MTIPMRDRYVTTALTVLLAIGLLAGGLLLGGLMLWLLGPALTIVFAVVAAVGFIVIRGAIRAAH